MRPLNEHAHPPVSRGRLPPFCAETPAFWLVACKMASARSSCAPEVNKSSSALRSARSRRSTSTCCAACRPPSFLHPDDGPQDREYGEHPDGWLRAPLRGWHLEACRDDLHEKDREADDVEREKVDTQRVLRV